MSISNILLSRYGYCFKKRSRSSLVLALGQVRPDSQLLKRERVRSKRFARKKFTVSACERPCFFRQSTSKPTAGSRLSSTAARTLFIKLDDAKHSLSRQEKTSHYGYSLFFPKPTSPALL